MIDQRDITTFTSWFLKITFRSIPILLVAVVVIIGIIGSTNPEYYYQNIAPMITAGLNQIAAIVPTLVTWFIETVDWVKSLFN